MTVYEVKINKFKSARFEESTIYSEVFNYNMRQGLKFKLSEVQFSTSPSRESLLGGRKVRDSPNIVTVSNFRYFAKWNTLIQNQFFL